MNKEKALKNQGLEFREDIYGKGGSIRYQGIVFSKYAVNKKKKKYTTRMIVDAFPLSDCFYITFDEHGNVFSYKLEKRKKQVIRKMYVNVREKMKEWGVEMEKMMKYTGGTYDL